MFKKISVDLLTLGVKLDLKDNLFCRKGGAGPSEGIFLEVGDKVILVPIWAEYVKKSPYEIRRDPNGWKLYKNKKELVCVKVILPPPFYNFKTQEGLPYKKIFLLHAKDCLATTVLQTCAYWNSAKRCKFCGIELSLKNGLTTAKKSPDELAEVAREALKTTHIKHIVLTTGSLNPPGREIKYLIKCASRIKEETNLPVHAQFLPPKDLGYLKMLKDSGVDTVGIHIECFHQDTLRKIAPIKYEIGFEKYIKTWKEAVKIFGPNQVSSYLIVGLGEPPQSVIWGSEILADLGVYPFVVPVRPIPGSLMENVNPPTSDLLEKIYSCVGKILAKKGLRAKDSIAGCVRCGACSALDLFEREPERFICHTARTEEELDRVFFIRKEVFVKEKKLFKNSDIDEYDPVSIYLVVKKERVVVGTVRFFPIGGGEYRGSRLAVLKGYRDFRAGSMLVKEAMKRVKKAGAKRFTAYILKENINFFKKLGWFVIGEERNMYGKIHRLMEADLNKIKLESI